MAALRSNVKICRVLGDQERMFYYSDEFTIIPSAFLVKSNLDLYSDEKQVLNKAIAEWKRIHPFLRCRIHKDDHDLYYAYADDDAIVNDSFHNVEFLEYKPDLGNE